MAKTKLFTQLQRASLLTLLSPLASLLPLPATLLQLSTRELASDRLVASCGSGNLICCQFYCKLRCSNPSAPLPPPCYATGRLIEFVHLLARCIYGLVDSFPLIGGRFSVLPIWSECELREVRPVRVTSVAGQDVLQGEAGEAGQAACTIRKGL